jgi:hypothetical protein
MKPLILLFIFHLFPFVTSSNATVESTISTTQLFDGISLASYMIERTINEQVLKSTLIATINGFTSDSIISITATSSISNSSVSVVTYYNAESVSESFALLFTNSIITGQYNTFLQSIATQYGSYSLMNASCVAAVVNTAQTSSASTGGNNIGLAVGLTIFLILMILMCCGVCAWYYRKLQSEMAEERQHSQQFNLTTFGQSNSKKNDGYIRTLSRHSTFQNIEEGANNDSQVELDDKNEKMIWTTPFHDSTVHGEVDDVGI